MINNVPWYWLLAFAIFSLSAIIELIWTIEAARYRKPLGLGGLIVTLYFLVMMSFVLWFGGVNIYLIRSGIITAIGVCMLGLLHIADIVARRRR